MKDAIKREWENLLYPELRPYRPIERDRLLKQAAETPFDLIEWLGILAGLVIVAAVTRYGVAGLGLGDRLAIAFANFLIALPLLLVAVGPFLVRRKRRGLRSLLQ